MGVWTRVGSRLVPLQQRDTLSWSAGEVSPYGVVGEVHSSLTRSPVRGMRKVHQYNIQYSSTVASSAGVKDLPIDRNLNDSSTTVN